MLYFTRRHTTKYEENANGPISLVVNKFEAVLQLRLDKIKLSP